MLDLLPGFYPFRLFDQFRFVSDTSPVIFSLDFTTNLSLGADATFSRISTATVTDWESLAKSCLLNEARIYGARRVQNLCTFGSANTEDVTTWNGNATALNATDVQFSGAYQFIFKGDTSSGTTVIAGHQYRLSIEVKNVSTTGDFGLYHYDADGGAQTTITLPEDWTRFSVIKSIAAGGTIRFGFHSAGGTGTVALRKIQVEDVTDQANQNPSEYVSVGVLSAPYHGVNVDGVKYFGTENGNTVDANSIVTEATGSAITGIDGLLMEPARTNYANNTDDLSGGADTIDLTTGGTGYYTLSVSGNAAVTVAAGTATGTGFGQATAGSDVTFNLSGAGTVTLTLDSGSLDTALGLIVYQVEKGSVATSWIPNTTTATTRNADALSYSGVDASNETRAVVDGANADADNWDGVVDATLLGADNIGEIASITVYKTGKRPV